MGQPESLQAPRVLIIEDEPILALDLKEFLSDDGFDIVGIAGKLSKALAMIETVAFDIAVIDTNLAGVNAKPAALAIKARGIPFVVLSGYSPDQHTGAFSGAVSLQKPCHPDRLSKLLRTMAAPQG